MVSRKAVRRGMVENMKKVADHYSVLRDSSSRTPWAAWRIYWDSHIGPRV